MRRLEQQRRGAFRLRGQWLVALSVALLANSSGSQHAVAEDVSAPAILQMFEAKWTTIENRMADIFEAGYGQMWLPPPQRADSGGLSVGYDVFDRFDLGKPRNETLYGTETSLKTTIAEGHRADVKFFTDFVPNHNGYGNRLNSTFTSQGGYPGFAITLPGDINGDFHDPTVSYETDSVNGSLFGLNDIAQEKNHQFIRQPTEVGNPANIPAGTIYNKPDANNARFYPDQGLGGIQMTDPVLGTTFTRYNFNQVNPLAGDPVTENATGLLMRNLQYMVQVIGVDGLRVDAAQHFPAWVMNYLDNAAFRANQRTNLDGTIKPVFMFSEVANGSTGAQLPYLRKDLANPLGISTNDTTVRGNRDVLDFPLFYSLVSNLSGNGIQNNWHGIRGASVDVADDGLHNGSAGVTFVDSHDNQSGGFPYLKNVGYAYTLMMPGNSIVYLNAKEFGNGRSFPHDEGGNSNPMSNDALGGYYDSSVTKLVEIRNAYGRGDFKERWIDEAFGDTNGDGQKSNIYIYERSKSVLVGLNSRLDDGYDERTPVQTDFAPNTYLVELTGNAENATVDPGNAIYHTLKANASGQIKMRVPRNSTHGLGYVIYGLPTPQGTMSLSNVSQVLAGGTPTVDNSGTTRLADIRVITGDAFSVQLNTAPVTIPAPEGESNPVRDVHADGDTAMIKIDDGLNINGVAGIDNTTVGSVGYGFENFTTTRTPGFIWNGTTNIGTGAGTYAQSIDATQLSEGRHYVTVRAFRHRDSGSGGDGGPSVFTDFKETIYVDRLKPVSAIASFDPYASDPNNPNNRDLIVRSTDGTASAVHVLLDLPANATQSEILAMVGAGNAASYYDRDAFIRGFNGLTKGNHVATVVTYEITGNLNVQRFPGLFTNTTVGAGFGDMNANGIIQSGDILGGSGTNTVEDLLFSQNSKFRAQFDVNGDGLHDNRDLFALGPALISQGAAAGGISGYTTLLLKRADVDGSGASNTSDIAATYANFGAGTWLYDQNVDGVTNINDVMTMVTQEFRTKAGDFNVDGTIDGADYVLWRKWQGSGTQYMQGDADFDGDVDTADLGVWRGNFGFVRLAVYSGPGSGTAVPEPLVLTQLSLALVVCGFTTTTRRTRR